MTMPPSGVKSEMDEDALIEAEIRQQLEIIDLDSDDPNNNIDDYQSIERPLQNLEDRNGDTLALDEAHDYLSLLQQQTERFERELTECDDLINYHNPDNGAVKEVDLGDLDEEASRAGVDPAELRRKILEEIEREDEIEDLSDVDSPQEAGQSGVPLFVTSEVELLTGKQDDGTDRAGEFEEQSTLEPGDGVVAVVDEIQTQEQFFKQQLQEMDIKYRQREAKWKQDTETRRREEEERENVENERRREIMIQHKQEEETLAQHKKIAAEKLEAEIEEKRKVISEEVKTFEEQITLLEMETRREQQELERSVQLQQEKMEHREKMSATAIQAGYRGYRVRKTSNSTLKLKREERAKLREEKRIQEVEEEIRQRKEEINKKKEEEKQKMEELQKVEEAKRKEEERVLREAEVKQRQEEIKKEEERKRSEEERKKKEEEKRREEDEKRQLEAKKAEEEKRKEENRKLEEQKMEKERKEKERLEEERKEKERLEEERKEKERLEEERKEKERLEEERKMKEQERLDKEKKEIEEERLRQEAEEKRLQEKDKEDSKLNEENRLREENERLKEELRKVRGENNTAESQKHSPETQLVKEVKSIAVTEPKIEVEQLQPESKGTSGEVRKSLKEKREKFEESKLQSVCQSGSADTLGSTLPSHLEARRLAWIKECLPWSKVSNEPWKLKGGVSKKPPRRPSSAKKLPPLSEDIVIAAARVATLKQVTTVQLSDLPGCTLSTLSHCWGLKSLTMTNCNLVALDSLNECKQLQYLNVKRNKLEYVDLKDLGNLQVVNLSNNNLSLVHGLDGCTNIRWLDLSCNRITRLGCLDPLRRLHTLILSSNQLISCSGISDVPTLQHLNLSNNHLQGLDGLHKLCLLQKLDVSANNLLQFPDVRNQVLLEECDMSDNSISSLDGLTSCWLPLLTTLSLAKNSLTEVDLVDNLLLLRSLDITNNQLLDLEGLCSAVSYLPYLEVINVQDNPATDGVTYHEKFTKVFTRLKTLDGTTVTSPGGTTVLHPKTDFEAMCMTQCQFHTSVRNTFLQELQAVESKSQVDDLALCEVYFRYCDKSFKMAVEHRYAHEYGEVSMTIPTAPTTPKSGRPQSARTKALQKDTDSYLSPKEMFEKALNSSNKKDEEMKQDGGLVSDNPRDLFEKALMATTKTGGGGAAAGEVHGGCSDAKKLFESSLRTETSQGMGSGKDLFEKSIQNQMTEQRTGSQNTAWPADTAQGDLNLRASLQNLPPDELAILEELHSAATRIQATWRGYNLRMKLSAALDYARREGDDDDSDLDDFNMDDLIFDEESLERGWRPTETPQLPQSHPVLGKPPIGRRGTPDVLKLELAPIHPPNRPRQAWRNADSPLSDLGPHPPRPPSSLRSVTDTHRTGLSKKEEKLAEEWGFQSSRTAELMMQRAKKMKLNSEKKQKLSKLDPKQRLALFRKLEETTKLSPIRPVVRRTLPRKEYFQAREDEIQRQDFVKRQEVKTRSVRTYEWLHTQVANFQEGPSERNSDYEGGHPVARHMNMTSGYDDSHSVEERRGRRFSSGEGSGQTTFLPPIKPNSAGSSGSNGGRRKEKMSWRNKPTDVDVGWGGGRKRHN